MEKHAHAPLQRAHLHPSLSAALHIQQLAVAPPPCTRRQLTALLLDTAPGNPLALLAAAIASDPRWCTTQFADVLATRTALQQHITMRWTALTDAACVPWSQPILPRISGYAMQAVLAQLPARVHAWLANALTERAAQAQLLHALTPSALAERAGWVIDGSFDRYAPTREHFGRVR